MTQIVLASGSRYRRELIERLGLQPITAPAGIEEIPHDGETPLAFAERMALEKALLIAAQNPDAIIVGSDQVAELDGVILQKPGNHAAAREQLALQSGRIVLFHSTVCVTSARIGKTLCRVNTTAAEFRELSMSEIENYLESDKPYDCAGSFKVESLGIALFRSIQSTDPTSLIGLPLIELCDLLSQFGVKVL